MSSSSAASSPFTPSFDLLILARWMAGHFSNFHQAQAQPQQFAHIHVLFRPLPFEFFGGIGLYSEQVYDYDWWRPYRQGVHRLIDQGDAIYIENYALTDALHYAGAARELSILHSIRPDQITRRYHCSMIFRRQGDAFHGAVEPGNRCIITKQGCPTYLVSQVELTETTWISLDRGFDPTTHQPVWGSEFGPLVFDKQASFAEELPRLP